MFGSGVEELGGGFSLLRQVSAVWTDVTATQPGPDDRPVRAKTAILRTNRPGGSSQAANPQGVGWAGTGAEAVHHSTNERGILARGAAQ
jgi:hypothetical protein